MVSSSSGLDPDAPGFVMSGDAGYEDEVAAAAGVLGWPSAGAVWPIPGATGTAEGVEGHAEALEAQAAMLPFWDEAADQGEHRAILVGFHTEPCADFHGPSAYCGMHRTKGRASQCFRYHFESQQRRSPVDPATGHLRYWDIPCPCLTSPDTPCPSGDPYTCIYAHSREEISYHPAKYKTRLCNGRGCRGEAICCFAHNEGELRTWAPERYSFWFLAGKTQEASIIAAAAAAQADTEAQEWAAATFGMPAANARNALLSLCCVQLSSVFL
eukprot:TRINITY_DN18200_c0_g1_i2.p1 TRINITY_DN18200_c0_g1~~TRINITY_DN18200_c0_g1_i2.p1  ORF type:complete len:270 (+),score=17.42 TRINITY_DN18200_c0_g1_i2:319-1128(+)